MFCTMKMPKKSLVVESFTQLRYSAIDFVLEFFDFVHCSPQTIRGDYPPDNGCKHVGEYWHTVPFPGP